MADILKHIGEQSSENLDAQDRLSELDEWNESIAEKLASAEGIELTKSHFEVLNFLRESYIEHGPSESVRRLTKVLDEKFAERGGRKYLYALFPKGPIDQGNRIAGLPALHGSTDPSFGSTH